MGEAARRQLTLFDVMILVAATGLGLGWYLAFREGLNRLLSMNLPRSVEWQYRLAGAIPLLVSYSLAVLTSGARRPRPARHRLVRRPGMVACLAVAVSSSLTGLFALGQLAYRGLTPPPAFPSFRQSTAVMSTLYLTNAGAAVAVAWVVVGLGSGWRPHADWVDQSGRALGLAWLLLFLASSVLGATH